jgi:tetratricopeptide (TPR) repeat protein
MVDSAAQLFDADQLTDLALQDLERNQLAAAEAKCLRVLSVHSQHGGALTALGRILHAQGRPDDALRVFNALTVYEPQNALWWMNLGSQLRLLGRYDEALAVYDRTVRIDTPSTDLMYNIGSLHMERGDYDSAYNFLGAALKAAPREARIRAVYAQCCYDTVRTEEALECLEGWENFANLTPGITAQIAYLLVTLGNEHRAQPALQSLLGARELDVQGSLTLVRILERVNRLSEAHAALDRLKLMSAANPDALLAEATLAERVGNHSESRDLLLRALSIHSDNLRRHPLLFALARSLDAMGHYDEAYSALAEAHQSHVAYIEATIGKTPVDLPAAIELARHECDPQDVAGWTDEGAPDITASPVFIIGFPRSGTTLLEQTLDAHPLLQSMDEQPFLKRALDDAVACGITYPSQLGKLTAEQCEYIRGRYWERVGRKVALQPGKRLVDKNPLNMMRLPLIRRIFPHSPLILAIRHPCDTLLSCYFQYFRAPDLVLMCRDLPTLAGNYRAAFDFWYSQTALLRPASYELRYETLVADFDNQVRGLSEFLQLPWDDAMLAPGAHASGKAFISTPSYSQVIQPVSSKAVGRWKNYERHFQSSLPALTPLLQRWNYPV